MNSLQGFDPLLFLGIKNIEEKDRERLKYELFNEISEYLVIRVSELLSTEQLKKINDSSELFSFAEKTIPNFQNKFKLFLLDFKKEFYSKI